LKESSWPDAFAHPEQQLFLSAWLPRQEVFVYEFRELVSMPLWLWSSVSILGWHRSTGPAVDAEVLAWSGYSGFGRTSETLRRYCF